MNTVIEAIGSIAIGSLFGVFLIYLGGQFEHVEKAMERSANKHPYPTPKLMTQWEEWEIEHETFSKEYWLIFPDAHGPTCRTCNPPVAKDDYERSRREAELRTLPSLFLSCDRETYNEFLDAMHLEIDDDEVTFYGEWPF